MIGETWCPFPLCTRYLISDQGRVQNTSTGRFLLGSKRPDGYWQVKLDKNRLLHSIVLETFKGPRPVGMLGLHEDDNPDNNRLSNLRWGTHKENCADYIRNYRPQGVDAAAAKLQREQVLEICQRLDAGERLKIIAGEFNVSPGVISHINKGSAWGWLTGRTADHARPSNHANHARRLNKAKAREIASRIVAGERQRHLAAEFGVSPQTIQQIASGRIWSHVTGIGAGP